MAKDKKNTEVSINIEQIQPISKKDPDFEEIKKNSMKISEE